MRGKVALFERTPHELGITPAYAGKRPPDTERGRATWDHPRLCGEKAKYGISEDELKGSPPPMRGKD